jgi:hypothetical protein
MKSEKDKIPKGKIQLGPQTQIRIELYTYSKNEEAISITFFRFIFIKMSEMIKPSIRSSPWKAMSLSNGSKHFGVSVQLTTMTRCTWLLSC